MVYNHSTLNKRRTTMAKQIVRNQYNTNRHIKSQVAQHGCRLADVAESGRELMLHISKDTKTRVSVWVVPISVELADGTCKSISDVEEGDEVIFKSGTAFV